MKLHIFSTALFLAASSMLSAQDLSKEITIEKDIVPQERQASRHNVAPAVSLPQVTTKPLGMSENSSAVQVPGLLTALEPAQGESTIGNSPYRGYAGIGYFPHPIFGASAGYRVIANSSTTLDVYGQYNYLSYERENPWGYELKNRKSALVLGALVNHKVNDYSSISADVDYQLYNFNTPLFDHTRNQRVNSMNISALWRSRYSNLDYQIGVKYGYFGFAHLSGMLFDNDNSLDPEYEEYPQANHENSFSLFGGVSLPMGDTSKAGIDLDASFLNYSNDIVWNYFLNPLGTPITYATAVDGYTRGAVSLTPYYSVSNDDFSARVGVDVALAVKSGDTFNIAPDVEVSWKPAPIFALWAKATGGQVLNSYRSLFNDNWYMNSSMANLNSGINYDLQAGINVGPIKGFSARLFGGYAATDNWLMPSVMINDKYSTNIYNANGYRCHLYAPVDLKGWHLGASLGYDYKGIAALELSYEMAPSDDSKGYYAWRDRAKRVFSASLSIRPIRKLSVSVDYSLRSDRAVYAMLPFPVASFSTFNWSDRIDLGDVNLLNISASYAITEQLSAFAEVNNLLGENWQDNFGVATAPVNGLIGIGYKF